MSRIAKPTPEDLTAASLIVLVAAVRYGKHLPEADRFLATYRSLASPPPLALASVNLTARKPEKTTATGNAYLRKTIARHGLSRRSQSLSPAGSTTSATTGGIARSSASSCC